MRDVKNIIVGILFLVMLAATWKVANIFGAIDVINSLGYEKATVEMLNDLSTNEIKKLVEEKKFAVVDGVYYFKGE